MKTKIIILALASAGALFAIETPKSGQGQQADGKGGTAYADLPKPDAAAVQLKAELEATIKERDTLKAELGAEKQKATDENARVTTLIQLIENQRNTANERLATAEIKWTVTTGRLDETARALEAANKRATDLQLKYDLEQKKVDELLHNPGATGVQATATPKKP